MGSLMIRKQLVEVGLQELPVLGQLKPVEELNEAIADAVHAKEIDEEGHKDDYK
jgi:hypothetical protein